MEVAAADSVNIPHLGNPPAASYWKALTITLMITARTKAIMLNANMIT